MNETKPRISLFFPVYRDEHTVETVIRKAIGVLSDVASDYEIIIIDDGSPDRSAEIAEELAAHNEVIRVIRHGKNRGYGAAIKTGFANCQYEWICFTDGDDEYDVFDLYKLIRLRDFYDLIITFRYVKSYSGFRQFVSWVYNTVLRVLFKTPYRDISTGLRLVRNYWEHTAPICWPPPLTYREVRALSERVLPGVRYRRHLLNRYSLVWRKS